MAYHFMNMVFLGNSIEGIDCFRRNEVLEKRGHLSLVKWAGGVTAGAINPAPLFWPQFKLVGVTTGTFVPSEADNPGGCQRGK